MKTSCLLIVLMAFFGLAEGNDSLSITSPATRIVYQRNLLNKATVQIKGNYPSGTTAVEARLVARVKGQGTSTRCVKIDRAPANGRYSGLIAATGGWYNLEVRAKVKHKKSATVVLERVGIDRKSVV